MSGKFSCAITEGAKGEELARVLVDYWRIGAGSMLFVDDIVCACKALGMSPSLDDIMRFTEAVNEHRGHTFATDVLTHAFVPQENVETVHELLDQITSLCMEI